MAAVTINDVYDHIVETIQGTDKPCIPSPRTLYQELVEGQGYTDDKLDNVHENIQYSFLKVHNMWNEYKTEWFTGMCIACANTRTNPTVDSIFNDAKKLCWKAFVYTL